MRELAEGKQAVEMDNDNLRNKVNKVTQKL